MGGVGIKVDKRLLRREKDTGLAEGGEKESAAPKALTTKLASCDTGIWLALHEFADRGRVAYPRAETRVNRQEAETIYAWHTNVKREYSQRRRQKEPKWDELRSKIEHASTLQAILNRATLPNG